MQQQSPAEQTKREKVQTTTGRIILEQCLDLECCHRSDLVKKSRRRTPNHSAEISLCKLPHQTDLGASATSLPGVNSHQVASFLWFMFLRCSVTNCYICQTPQLKVAYLYIHIHTYIDHVYFEPSPHRAHRNATTPSTYSQHHEHRPQP